MAVSRKAAGEGGDQTTAAAESIGYATIQRILANDGSVLRNQDHSAYASQTGEKKKTGGINSWDNLYTMNNSTSRSDYSKDQVKS